MAGTNSTYLRLIRSRCSANAKDLAVKYKANGLKNGKSAAELDKTIKAIFAMDCNISGPKKRKPAKPKTATRRKPAASRKRA